MVRPSNYVIIKDSGELETKKMNITGVREISVSGFANLTIEQCKTSPEILTIIADKNIIPNLNNEIHIRKLTLCFKNERNTPITYHAIVQDISKIKTSGSVKTKINTIETNILKLDMSGSTHLDATLAVKELKAEFSGVSKDTLKGTATKQQIGISGASEYNASELCDQIANIKTSGDSSACLDIVETLLCHASGASSIFVSRQPYNQRLNIWRC